ncbi:hypothetical protein ACA910_010831 [Epithemia clementina (nom. ined.)]
MSLCSDENVAATFGEDQVAYANRHIPAFLRLPSVDDVNHDLKSQCRSSLTPPAGNEYPRYSCSVQLIKDGSILTAESLKDPNNKLKLSMHQPMLVTDIPQSIGIVLPEEEGFGVREVSEIIGPRTPVRVIDVGMQQELEGWNLGDLVDYFEDEDRLRWVSRQQQGRRTADATSHRRQRRAAIQAAQKQQAGAVLNQISLEFSQTPLRSKVQSPHFVRALDWIENTWPTEYKTAGFPPSVQFYCLTSAAGSFTDFHVDFGGTSVWYNVLTGQKQFCLIPPTHANLQAYKEWLCLKTQSETFLPDMLPEPSEAFRITLQAKQTLIIPSGWIHAVYTTQDSLVFGGNFLHGLDVEKQLEVFMIEKQIRVLDDYRFPFFIELHFCIVCDWFRRIRSKAKPLAWREWHAIPALCEPISQWYVMSQNLCKTSFPGAPTVSRFVEDLLRETQFENFEQIVMTLRNAYEQGYDKHVACADVETNSSESAADAPSCFSREDQTSLSIANPPKLPPSKYRIKLSTKSSRSLATVVHSTNQREGLTSFPHEVNDEEWLPSPAKKSSGSSGIPPKRNTAKLRSPESAPVPIPGPKPKRAKKSSGISARERLLKKVM